jgi:hypothetical protein
MALTCLLKDQHSAFHFFQWPMVRKLSTSLGKQNCGTEQGRQFPRIFIGWMGDFHQPRRTRPGVLHPMKAVTI